jgi:hypothetical protein
MAISTRPLGREGPRVWRWLLLLRLLVPTTCWATSSRGAAHVSHLPIGCFTSGSPDLGHHCNPPPRVYVERRSLLIYSSCAHAPVVVDVQVVRDAASCCCPAAGGPAGWCWCGQRAAVGRRRGLPRRTNSRSSGAPEQQHTTRGVSLCRHAPSTPSLLLNSSSARRYGLMHLMAPCVSRSSQHVMVCRRCLRAVRARQTQASVASGRRDDEQRSAGSGHLGRLSRGGVRPRAHLAAGLRAHRLVQPFIVRGFLLE